MKVYMNDVDEDMVDIIENGTYVPHKVSTKDGQYLIPKKKEECLLTDIDISIWIKG